MSDWTGIDVPAFDDAVLQQEPPFTASTGLMDRLPFKFDSKREFLQWRDALAEGFGVDGRDVVLVGSAATGRSLSTRRKRGNRHGVFGRGSDLDIAVVSPHHFDVAWRWFRRTNPLFLTGLDEVGRERFEAHKSHYVYEGIIAADYFLSYLPFGDEWSRAMQQTQVLLPTDLRGRLMKTRIYRDFASLREHQAEAIRIYKLYLEAKRQGNDDK